MLQARLEQRMLQQAQRMLQAPPEQQMQRVRAEQRMQRQAQLQAA